MNALIGALLPLGIAAALSPMPLIALLLVLSSKRRVANGIGFFAGSMAATAALTAATATIALVIPNDPQATTHPVYGVLRIVLGAAMIVFGVVSWRGRPKAGQPARQPAWLSSIEDMGFGRAVLFGALLSLANVKNVPIAFAAGSHIAESGALVPMLVGGVVFVALACGAMATVIAAAFAFPARTAAPLERLRDTLVAHNAVILAVVFVLAGASLIGHGIAVL